ncbi:DPP IV N-terminal domain-containing protein [Emticicia sp. C21]|uniref:DPP IV N-terminal domain-containing protein n=1 Tax=Emticicia sp. C21 TaxID=2302915 RepID=UPI000E342B2D|nr:DPP IV N-terminal domain-containing protein [Emticicia sp. C21]RFS15053.1 hypothetical protein D0T08_18420 [Emticicia sp. C21]
MNKTLFLAAIILLLTVQGCRRNSSQNKPAKPQASVFPSAPGTTGNAEGLTRETNEPANEFYARISNDGKYIYYNAVESTTTVSFLNSGGLFDPRVKTNKKTKIVRKEIGVPITNPLKDNAAYATEMPNGNILFTYVLPAKPVIAFASPQGVGINYISQGEMGDDDSQPIISKGGSKIVFSTLVGGIRMICTMDSKGGNFTVITEGHKPQFLPNDENVIFYNLIVNKTVQIFTLNLKTGQKSQLTTGEYNNKDAAFTRDGRYIAFVSNRENPKYARHHVYVMKADGTNIKQITQGETDEADPAWGPDGMLYFSSNAAKNYSIWKAKPTL